MNKSVWPILKNEFSFRDHDQQIQNLEKFFMKKKKKLTLTHHSHKHMWIWSPYLHGTPINILEVTAKKKKLF